MMRAIVCSIALSLGCSHSAPATSNSTPATGSASCSSDADCVAVKADCCGCNQGGKAIAILAASKAAYEANQAKTCADTMCPQVMSNDPSCSMLAKCNAGQCTLGK